MPGEPQSPTKGTLMRTESVRFTANRWILTLLISGLIIAATAASAIPPQSDAETATGKVAVSAEGDESTTPAGIVSQLKFRSLGPALMSGRIGDFAVNPNNKAEYYVAVASGGVWKTINSGITFESVFDTQGSYSIGCVTIDSKNTNVVWVGTGENNSQRSVSFGDGVYKSLDGGKHWLHMGLRDSEHIGMIAIDPRDSDVVYVAAQGPLWRSGGDRGLYKTTDGGATWQCVLFISDDTGISEVHLDPRDPDVLYASAYQRRRHVWTLVNGGPESAIHKSTDGGKTWRELTNGLPEKELGRIGLDISPANPDVLYAIIELPEDKGGVWRSTDRGETWEKRSDYISASPQYYNELVCDPVEVDRVYSLDTFLHVTNDGGKTFHRTPRQNRHVDDHALWIDPANNDYLLIGCDGGVYETFDRGEHWRYMPNLPVTQFYRISVDNAEPFYHIYGGTQDNSTVGAPTRTTDRIGIANEDWFLTVGGDGYETQVDPEDPNIVYSLWQYGGLVRFDRRSGERLDIKPREKPGEEPNRWNWDSPLLLSPHLHTRLYFASQRLYRSDDGGNSWRAISGDLTRGLDRDSIEVMGKVQLADAVAKHNDTSVFGNCVSLTESPLVEGLIYVGTDDGLIQVTEDGGKTWRRIDLFPGIPDMTYVSCLWASQHDADTVYAGFDNHKNGDFSPYLLVSRDRGRTWTSIVGDLPERNVVLSFAEDHVKKELLFAGTEFGVFFTLDRGKSWTQLKNGVPTISVRDIAIQKRENDLLLGTFGRGIYVLDDYSPLRHADAALAEAQAAVFPIEDALLYVERSRLGARNGKGTQGASFYSAPNPPHGAVITYHLKDKIKTRKETRHEAEKIAAEAGKTPHHPTLDEFREEDREREPQVFVLIRNAAGKVLRQVSAPRDKGLHRVAWDLRYPSSEPARLDKSPPESPWASEPQGPMVLPGKYSATLCSEIDGKIKELTQPVTFDVVALAQGTFQPDDPEAVHAFRLRVAELQRAVTGAVRVADKTKERLDYLRAAIEDTPDVDLSFYAEVESIGERLDAIRVSLRGDPTYNRRNEAAPPSISERVSWIVGGQWSVTCAPTQTHRDQYAFAAEEFAPVLASLRTMVEEDIPALEVKIEAAGAPWTPGRVPTWEKD